MADQVAASDSGKGLCQLVAEGVSPWLDGVSHEVIASGRLTRLARDVHVRGAMSNVEVLVEAIANDWHYRDRLAALAKRGSTVDEAIRSLSGYDVRRACTEFREVFDTTGGLDGQVSIDVDPTLAGDAMATVRAAIELVGLVNRANLLVKILVAEEGITAIRDCLGRGIGVHATGIYSVRRYGEVLDAYFDGLEHAAAAGLPLAAIAMATSVPVGRIDAAVDAGLDALGTGAGGAPRGKAALAIARLTYRRYEQQLSSQRWRALSAAGARPPRLMWTETATTDPAYPFLWYVNEFVAWGTVNAMSLSTLETALVASKPHGDTLTNEHTSAAAVLDELERLGVPVAELADRLEATDARRQAETWRTLRETVAKQLRASGGTPA